MILYKDGSRTLEKNIEKLDNLKKFEENDFRADLFFKLKFANWDLDSVKSFFMTKLLHYSNNPFEQYNNNDKNNNAYNDNKKTIKKKILKFQSGPKAKAAEEEEEVEEEEVSDEEFISKTFKESKVTSTYDYSVSGKRRKNKEYKVPESISNLVNCIFYFKNINFKIF